MTAPIKIWYDVHSMCCHNHWYFKEGTYQCFQKSESISTLNLLRFRITMKTNPRADLMGRIYLFGLTEVCRLTLHIRQHSMDQVFWRETETELRTSTRLSLPDCEDCVTSYLISCCYAFSTTSYWTTQTVDWNTCFLLSLPKSVVL